MAAPGYTEGEVPPLSRVVSRPLNDDEKSKVREVFDKFDKDKSGQINISELTQMAAELGATVTQEDAAKIMAQIDQNQNQQCSFDEFLLWWTSDPKLGGYNNLVLQLMKMKLAAQVRTGQVAARLAQAKPTGAVPGNEIGVKAEMDISPGLVGCEPKMSVRAMVREAREQRDDCFAKFVLTVASEAGGEVVQTAIDGLAPLLAMAPFNVNTAVEGDKVTILITTPAEMVPREFIGMGQFALAALPKLLEGNISWSKSFEDVVAFEHNPLRNLLGAVKVSEHVRIDTLKMAELIDNLVSDRDARDQLHQSAHVWGKVMKCMLKAICGFEADIRVGYHEQFFKSVLDFFKPFLGDMGPLAALQQDWGNHSINQIRDIMLMMMIQMDIDPKKPPPEIAAVLTPVRALAKHVKTVDTLTIGGIPNTPLEIHLEFVEFNPFPVAGYLLETLGNVPAKVNPGGKPTKPLSAAETDRIKVIFEKFDKNKSGGIDLNEIKAMCQELGAPISDDEAKEAMAELDKGGTGTCNFDDFKTFWTGRGGPSSLALKFLRAKMTAKNTLQSFVSWARAPVNVDNRLEIKVKSTCTPGMTECGAKMSIDMALKPGAGGFAGTVVRVEANDPAAANSIKTFYEQWYNKMVEMSGQPPFALNCEVDGATVLVKLGPPEGMPIEALVPFLQDPQFQEALKNLNFKYNIAFGSTFGDLIQNGDKPFYHQLGGVKTEGSISVSANTKKMLVDMIPNEHISMRLAKAMLNFFAGLEVTVLSGYNPEGFDEAVAEMLINTKPYDPDEAGKSRLVKGVLVAEIPEVTQLRGEEHARVGMVTFGPDNDDDIKMTSAVFVQSGYLKSDQLRAATDEEKAEFVKTRKGMVCLNGLRELALSTSEQFLESEVIGNPGRDQSALLFEVCQSLADVWKNIKSVTSVETGDGRNATMVITFNNFLINELATFFLGPVNEKVQAKKPKFEEAFAKAKEEQAKFAADREQVMQN